MYYIHVFITFILPWITLNQKLLHVRTLAKYIINQGKNLCIGMFVYTKRHMNQRDTYNNVCVTYDDRHCVITSTTTCSSSFSMDCTLKQNKHEFWVTIECYLLSDLIKLHIPKCIEPQVMWVITVVSVILFVNTVENVVIGHVCEKISESVKVW